MTLVISQSSLSSSCSNAGAEAAYHFMRSFEFLSHIESLGAPRDRKFRRYACRLFVDGHTLKRAARARKLLLRMQLEGLENELPSHTTDSQFGFQVCTSEEKWLSVLTMPKSLCSTRHRSSSTYYQSREDSRISKNAVTA